MTKFAGKWPGAVIDKSLRISPVVEYHPPKTVNPCTSRFVPYGGTLKLRQVYTGTELIGIAVLHKSCLQPIFNIEHAVDAAHMRR